MSMKPYSFNEFNKANQQVENSTKNVSDQFKELTKTIAAGVIEEVAVAAKDASINFLSLRTQLINAKEGLYQLEQQGKKNSKEWYEQRALIEKLAVANQNLNKSIKDLGSNTKVFSGLLEGVRGVAAGFEVAKSAAMLFGASQEQAEQAIKKLVPVMAALQGLQELQIITSEESTAVLLVEKGQRLANAAAIQLQTAVESENIIISKAATAAQWALNVAMEANPIMIVVGALGAAVAALLYFTSGMEDATDAQKDFNKEIDSADKKLQDSYVKKMQLTGELTEQEAKAYQITLNSVREKMALDSKANEEKKKNLKDYAPDKAAKLNAEIDKQTAELSLKIEEQRQLGLYNLRQEALNSLAEQEASDNLKRQKEQQQRAKAAKDAKLKEWQEAQKALDELVAQSIADENALYDEQSKRTIARMKNEAQNLSNEKDKLSFIEDFYTHKAEIENAFESMSFEEFQEWEKKKRKEYKETADAEKKQLDDSVKAKEKAQAEKTALIKEGAKVAIQIAQTVADAIFTIQKNNRDADLSAELSLLDRKKERELSNKHNTAAQIEAINARYHRIEAAAKLKAWKADQEAAATQAGIKMALGVVNAWATSSSWIQALIQTAAVVAAGAAEIAVIKSQKPPQFAAGTEYVQLNGAPRGTDTIHAMVNEGERIVPTHINEQLKGVANEDLPALVQAALYSPMPHAPEMGGVSVVVKQDAIDYKKMAKAIATEIAANPTTHINIDKGGFSVHLRDKQRHVELLNNRYASK